MENPSVTDVQGIQIISSKYAFLYHCLFKLMGWKLSL
jgi:hypothetical protein